MKILRYDDDTFDNQIYGYNPVYDTNSDSYGVIPYKAKLDPVNSWTFPLVTDHRYKIHWRYGLDFTNMKISQSSPRWATTDKNIYLVMNFTDVRAKVNITTTDGEVIDN